MNDLEKMDALKTRLNVSYAQAKEALDVCDGDLLEALVYLERQERAAESRAEQEAAELGDGKADKENAESFVRGLIEQIKTLIQDVNVTKVRLISGDKTLIEIPASIGVVGLGLMLFSPLLLAVSALGAVAALKKEMIFEIEKADGTVERRNLKLPGFGGRDKGGEDECGGDCGCGGADCPCEGEAEGDSAGEGDCTCGCDGESKSEDTCACGQTGAADEPEKSEGQ